MKKIFAIAAMLVASTAFAGVSNSAHNMNTFTGDTNDVCYYCHAAHNTRTFASGYNVPLWARNDGTGVSAYYASNSISVNISSLDSLSGACMSCHDGSLDVGQTIKGDLTPTDDRVSGNALLSDLTNDHPVSLTWTTNAGLDTIANVVAASTFKLYGASGNMLTCASCHVVHDNTIAKFLREDPATGSFCVTCHANK